MEWKLKIELWAKTILTRGSEFLMDWTSWSQTWSTTSTTTTSRKPVKRRRKYLRWRRKYFLLQADQRLNQNRKDLPLLAHLQELYLSVKEDGLMLSQELVPISLTQCKKIEYSSSSWSITSRRRWCDWILESNGISSKRSCAISTLVWWNVEEQDGRWWRQQE